MVASAAAEVLQATRASISLRDGRTRGDLYLAAVVGLSPEYVAVLNGRRRGQVGRGVSGTAMQSRRPVVVPDVATAPGFEDWREAAQREGYASMVSMPLAVHDAVFGVLNIYRPSAGRPSAAQLRVLGAVARQAALAVRNAQLAHASAVHLALVESTLASLRAQAHEFSNKVHAISGLLSIGEYAKAQAFIGALTEAPGSATNDLTDRIRDVTFAAYLLSAKRAAAGRGVELSIDPRSHLGALPPHADVLTFITIAGNLITNAVDAVVDLATSRRRVQVQLAQDAEQTVLTVKDHGDGLPVGESESVFAPGFTTKRTGGGIGLSLVYDEVSRLGGQVTVERDGDAWTRFVVVIPHEPGD
jgi:signal transduction histidine kinase